MKFELVEIPRGVKLRCVYMMTFDTGRFYIGSTRSLKTRMSCWRSLIYAGKTKNTNVNKEALLSSCVSFSVLRLVGESEDILSIETEFIKNNIGNKFLLNIHKQPKATKKEIKNRDQIASEAIESGRYFRIGKYDMDWNLVEVYDSIFHAAGRSKNRVKEVRPVVNGKKKKYNGFYYRRLDLQMNPIHPEINIKPHKLIGTKMSDSTKKKLMDSIDRRRLLGVINSEKRKPIHQIDMNGVIVNTFVSFSQAERELGICHRNIAKVIKGRRKSAGGFIFSLA